MSNAGQQTLGCGGIIALAVFSTILISRCSGSEPKNPLEAVLTELEIVDDKIDETRLSLVRLKHGCEGDFPLSSLDEQGRQSQAEWDAAAANNLDNISIEQEWEIRRSIGVELGIAPSEVDGWKEIYRARAEASQRELAEDERKMELRQQEWLKGREGRCEFYQQTQDELKSLELERDVLRAKRKRLRAGQ